MRPASGRSLVEATPERGAEVLRVPPPLYYGAGFGAGLLLRVVTVPLAIAGGPATRAVGGVVLAAGAALCLAAVAAVIRHRTTIVPHHPVSRLLTSGAYRISRNPMYTALTVAYLGGTMLAGSWWPLATLPIVLVFVRNVVIAPEERYLADHFRQPYLDYQSRVRRWL
jgi:protein-S-isoprenylcysteine O-methyltransferase Ste14